MCGIVGILGDIRGVDHRAMLNALAQRGPDGTGEHAETGVWLGHRRLAIIDPTDAARQPMTLDRLTIVFNGEIYNYRELREELEAKGHSFRTASDTEVILHGFLACGATVFSKLRGMFALAIWDRQSHELILARDRIGEKPLYYHRSNDRFLFASEVRALLASNVIERQIDPDGLDAYLTFGSVADPYTLVRGVSAVAAGDVVTVPRPIEMRRHAFWSLRDVKPAAGRDREAVVAGVRRSLDTAMSRCLVADVPVAVLLSGGIDSSANVTMLAERGVPDLRTFSVTFRSDRANDESEYSDLVAKRFATKHTSVDISLEEARALVPSAVARMDQPTHDGVNTFLVCRAVHQAGLKVAISGQGSDELFLGYAQRRWFPLAARLAQGLASPLRPAIAAVARRLGGAPRAAKALWAVAQPDPVASAYLALHAVFSQTEIENLRGSIRPPMTRFIEDVGGETPLDRLSRLQIRHYLKNTLLRDGDQMSMATSVELRAPFVDADLVAHVVALPAAQRIERDRNKPLLLDAVGPGLPREVWDRPKRGFGLPYDRWLREGLADLFAGTKESPLVPARVEAVRHSFLKRHQTTRYWTLIILHDWIARERLGARFL